MSRDAASPTPVAWVGVSPEEDPGDEPIGIWLLRRDGDGALSAHLAADAPAPSFLAVHPEQPVLYAVGEGSPGTVAAYDVGPGGSLTLRHRVRSGGDGPCHVAVVPGVGLLVAHYVSGSVTRVPLGDDGGLAPRVVAAGEAPAEDVVTFTGSGPRADRQDGPHAHSTHVAPDGSLLVADLGADVLHAVRADGAGLVGDGAAVTFPAGAGPRHMATLDEDHLVVIGELDAQLHVVRWEAGGRTRVGTGTAVGSSPAAHAPQVSGDEVLAAHVSLDGGHVLATVRGSDVVGVHRVVGEGDDPRLEHVSDLPVGGSWPRHHAVVDGDLLVALQRAGRVAVLRPPSPGEWAPAALVEQLDVPHAACVLPVPERLRV